MTPFLCIYALPAFGKCSRPNSTLIATGNLIVVFELRDVMSLRCRN